MPGAGIVRMSGGIGRTGGVLIGKPSPTGEWDPRLDNQTVDFDRDEFTHFIADKGYKVCWEKAILCPNVPGTGLSPRDHVMGCTVCDGRGFIYVQPCQTSMLMQGIKLNQSFYAYGRWDMGNMLVTAEPGFALDYFDRITLKDGVSRFTERVVRQPSVALDVLKYNPLCIEYIAWVSRTNTLVSFVVDDDFIVSADGSGVTWLAGANQPDAGSFYSIGYTYRPQYIVLDLVHHHRDSTVDGKHFMFPVQAVAKLDYLVRNEGSDAPQIIDQNPFKQ